MRKLLVNLSVRSLLIIIEKIITFFTIPLISYSLGVKEFGYYVLVQTYVSYSFLFGDFGYTLWATRIISQLKNNSTKAIIESITGLKFISYCINFIIVFVLIAFFEEYKIIELFLLTSVYSIGQIINIEYVYFAKKDLVRISIYKLIIRILGFVFSLIIYFYNPVIYLFLLVFASVNLLYSIVLLIDYKIIYGDVIYIRFKNSLNYFKKSFKLGLGTRINLIKFSFPIIIGRIFLSEYRLGLLTAVLKLLPISYSLLDVARMVIGPEIINLKLNRHIFKKLLKISFILIAVLALLFIPLVFYSDKIIITIFSSEFIEATKLFNFSLYIIFLFLPVLYLWNTVINFLSFDKVFINSSIFSIILLILSLPVLSLLFAEIGIILSIGLSNIVSVFIVINYFKNRESYKFNNNYL